MIITGSTPDPRQASAVRAEPQTPTGLGAMPTIVAVVITRIYRSALLLRARQCGMFYCYETHLDRPDRLAIRVACLCPDGHGVAGLPWRGWLTTDDGRFDLADLPDPAHLSVPVRLADLRPSTFVLERATEDAA